MTRPFLTYVNPNGSTKRIPLSSNRFRMGRSLNNEYVVEDVGVSRTHCVIEFNGVRWTITDRSANGTRLNGTTVGQYKMRILENGDVINLNEFQNYMFVIPPDPEPAPACTRLVPISEEGLQNITDSVMADLEAFQNEYNSQENDEAIFNNASVNNTTVPSSSEQPTSSTACASGSNTAAHSKGKEQPASQSQSSNSSQVEDELLCSICTEMFVQAMTLSCSHTFCNYCITQWQKNRPICPICRQKITELFPTRVVDNFIEKIMATASDDVKQRRQKLIDQRKAPDTSCGSTSKDTPDASSSSVEYTDEDLYNSESDYDSDDDELPYPPVFISYNRTCPITRRRP